MLVFRSPHTRTMPQAMSLPWTHSDVDLESGYPLPSNRPHPLVRNLWSERLADQPAGLFYKETHIGDDVISKITSHSLFSADNHMTVT